MMLTVTFIGNKKNNLNISNINPNSNSNYSCEIINKIRIIRDIIHIPCTFLGLECYFKIKNTELCSFYHNYFVIKK